MINNNEIVICPMCDKESTLKEWDDFTVKECKSREMRRAYVHLNLEKAFKRKTDTMYLCPKCNNWSRGSTLRIKSNNLRLARLGGEPRITIEEA